MSFLHNIRIILFALVVLVLFCNCSSTTQTSRYNKSHEEETQKTKNEVRFTSEDDSAKIAEDSEIYTTYNPPESELIDGIPVESSEIKDEFVTKYNKLKSANIPFTSREKILFEIINYIDTPYQYGGNNNFGIDCSAFTQNVMSKSINMKLPRTAREQYLAG